MKRPGVSKVITAIMASEDRAKVSRILRQERIDAHAQGMDEGYLFAMREVRNRQGETPAHAVAQWVRAEIDRLVARGVR